MNLSKETIFYIHICCWKDLLPLCEPIHISQKLFLSIISRHFVHFPYTTPKFTNFFNFFAGQQKRFSLLTNQDGVTFGNLGAGGSDETYVNRETWLEWLQKRGEGLPKRSSNWSRFYLIYLSCTSCAARKIFEKNFFLFNIILMPSTIRCIHFEKYFFFIKTSNYNLIIIILTYYHIQIQFLKMSFPFFSFY